jgi:alkaline phosphatase
MRDRGPRIVKIMTTPPMQTEAPSPVPQPLPGLSRRRLLRSGGLGALGALGGLAPAAALAQGGATPAPAKPRNLIFLVADGMSAGALAIADRYAAHVVGRPLRWSALVREAGIRRSQSSTHAADSHVTDSAAASSAWSTGVKHTNGALCIDPAGRRLEPLWVRARRAGLATGVVTTTTVTHATPAGFYCNVDKRVKEPEIAAQLLERGIDVAIGGGRKHFSDALLAAHPEVKVARTAAELNGAPAGGRLLGLMSTSHVPYALERDAGEPPLAEMARVALNRLAAHSAGGFVLQVEGGRVDHAAHNNDAFALVGEMMDFDAALAVCADFARGRSDTLVVVSTDHATANPGMTLYGKPGNEGLSRLAGARKSLEWVNDAVVAGAKGKSAEQIAELALSLTREATGIGLNGSAREVLRRLAAKERPDPFSERNILYCVLGGLLSEHCGIAFVSPHHTGDFVDLFAFGPGSETLPAFIDNAELSGWIASAMDLPPAKA